MQSTLPNLSAPCSSSKKEKESPRQLSCPGRHFLFFYNPLSIAGKLSCQLPVDWVVDWVVNWVADWVADWVVSPVQLSAVLQTKSQKSFK